MQNQNEFTLAELCESHRSKQLPLVGQNVKLIFELNEPAEVDGKTVQTERMWVCVTKIDTIDDKTVYSGFINNDPVALKSVSYKDIVRFTSDNIEQVLTESDYMH